MTFSYTGNPGIAGSSASTAQNNLDAVRLIAGDTDPNEVLLQDEEITALMYLECGGNTGAINVYRAVSSCCYTISTQFSRLADKQIGPAQLKSSQKSLQYKQRGDEWFLRGRMWDVTPYAGGISINDKMTVEQDTDRVAPAFIRDLQTFAGVIGPIYDPAFQTVPGGN